ncbi:MAG: hypothetical protein EBQ85_11955 [Proteobacteria bacterium]|nr:hypothetical protein [Pseudomonadota bacterium]
MINKCFNLVAIVSFLFPFQNFAMDFQQKLQLQEALENRILPVVRTFDREASVVVNLEEKKETELPEESRAFSFQNEGLGVNDSFQFQKFQVLILSRMTEVPDTAKTLIRKITRDMNVAPQIVLETTPENSAKEVVEQVPIKVELKGMEEAQAHLSSVSSLLFAAIGLMAFAFFVVGGMLFPGRRASTSQNQTTNKESKNEPQDVRANFVSQEKLIGYSDEALLAVISDCYWSEEDEYAAFVWNQTPVEQRKNIVTGNGFLKKYVASLSNRTQINLKHLDHPYYFSPLSINHLDNKTVTDLVRKHPGLLNRLSPLRLQHLHLKVLDRIFLEKEAVSKNQTPDFGGVAPAKERALPNPSQIPLGSLDEEELVGEQKTLPLKIKSRILTLSWLCELPKDKQREILSQVSDQELAAAWTGPKSVLNKLFEALEPKRQESLSSLLLVVKPSRSCDAFHKLHSWSLEALQVEASKRNVTQIKKAA